MLFAVRFNANDVQSFNHRRLIATYVSMHSNKSHKNKPFIHFMSWHLLNVVIIFIIFIYLQTVLSCRIALSIARWWAKRSAAYVFVQLHCYNFQSIILAHAVSWFYFTKTCKLIMITKISFNCILSFHLLNTFIPDQEKINGIVIFPLIILILYFYTTCSEQTIILSVFSSVGSPTRESVSRVRDWECVRCTRLLYCTTSCRLQNKFSRFVTSVHIHLVSSELQRQK